MSDSSNATPRGELLDEANNIVNGDRNAQYGDPNDDFKRSASLMGTYLAGVASRKIHGEWQGEFSGKGLGITEDEALGLQNATRESFVAMVEELIDPHDIAWMMILLKASRSTHSPYKRDNFTDAAGYAACGWDCVESIPGVNP